MARSETTKLHRGMSGVGTAAYAAYVPGSSVPAFMQLFDAAAKNAGKVHLVLTEIGMSYGQLDRARSSNMLTAPNARKILAAHKKFKKAS